MDIVQITPENLEGEHICCAISTTPDAKACARAKKDWMAPRFAEGYHFAKLDAKGKVFIEYTPGENAWCPVDAKGWLLIDCLWVSGSFKGKGVANALFETAAGHAREMGMKGLVALTSDKKRPYLSDPGFYAHKGFVAADEAPPYYRLVALPFEEGAALPKFLPHVRQPHIAESGFVAYWSGHCPHTGKYVPLMEAVAKKHGIPFHSHKLATTAEAQAAPNPFTTFALYYNGTLLGNEMFSEAKLEKYILAL